MVVRCPYVQVARLQRASVRIFAAEGYTARRMTVFRVACQAAKPVKMTGNGDNGLTEYELCPTAAALSAHLVGDDSGTQLMVKFLSNQGAPVLAQ